MNFEINVRNQNDNVKLYRPGQSQPIELPILAKEMHYAAKVTYSPHLGKYVLLPHTWRGRDLASHVETWPLDQPYRIYLIASDGSVNVQTIPTGPWRPTAVYPSQRGMVWVSNETNGSTQPAGGRLIQGDQIIKLYDHYSSSAGISPDGCKLAYANNDMHPETVEYVSVIDLCTPETKE